MPIYEFECQKCNAHTEIFQKMSDKPPIKCDKCGGRLEKQVSASAIQFKGSGWYVTDYAGNGKKAAEKAESEAASASDKAAGDSDKAAGASDKAASASDIRDSKKSDKKSKDDSPSKKTSEKASSTKVSSGD
ncbi:MAG: zinc ribbon domain-containing protein [Acidobacteria bacterium]|nr:zinc ribbon domain-containing protein [Acidobacteriota bacterium]MCA1600583.1 zinc ribbon domain-containing protein [Acidobacteriota bacterium]